MLKSEKVLIELLISACLLIQLFMLSWQGNLLKVSSSHFQY